MNPDAALVEEYCADPLNTVGNLPARTGNQAYKGMQARGAWQSLYPTAVAAPASVPPPLREACRSRPGARSL